MIDRQPTLDHGYAFIARYPRATSILTIPIHKWDIDVIDPWGDEEFIGEGCIDGVLCFLFWSLREEGFVAQVKRRSTFPPK